MYGRSGQLWQWQRRPWRGDVLLYGARESDSSATADLGERSPYGVGARDNAPGFSPGFVVGDVDSIALSPDVSGWQVAVDDFLTDEPI